jgi:hypothetical protein
MLYTMSCLADGDWASPKSISVWSNPSMPSIDNVKKLLFQFFSGRGAQKLTVENLKVVWTKFSTLS